MVVSVNVIDAEVGTRIVPLWSGERPFLRKVKFWSEGW